MTTTARGARHAVIAATVATLSFTLAGCGDTTSPGTAVPAPTTTSETSTKTKSTTATSSANAESLADTDPCELLSTTDKSALGVKKSTGPEEFAGARICRIHTAAGSLTPGIWDKAGLAQVIATGPISDVTIGSHQAKQMGDSAGCTVFIGVTASSRVDVVAQDRQGDQDEACDLALRAAKLIEPNLPKS